jgi:glycosyltransferase involved in cell wall biosynthesis
MMGPGLPMFHRGNVAALIPAYFEADHIGDVVRRTRCQLDQVLVVDDGSTDGTQAAARAAGAEVIRHEVNQGKGAALKTGLRLLGERPGVEFVLMLDGDGQHVPEEIPAFLDAANRSGARCFVGSRMNDLTGMPWLRRITNLCMSAYISAVCGQRVADTQCGFRMVHRDWAGVLVECPSRQFEFETEMLVTLSRLGCKIDSVPVSTVYGTEKSKIQSVDDTLRFIKLMWRLQKARPKRC